MLRYGAELFLIMYTSGHNESIIDRFNQRGENEHM